MNINVVNPLQVCNCPDRKILGDIFLDKLIRMDKKGVYPENLIRQFNPPFRVLSNRPYYHLVI